MQQAKKKKSDFFDFKLVNESICFDRWGISIVSAGFQIYSTTRQC